MEYKKINSNKRLYSSLMAISLIAFVCQPEVHAQTNNFSSIVPVVSLLLNEDSVVDETPEGPIGNVDCPSDAEVAEVRANIANGIDDPRAAQAAQIFNQSDVDELAGVIVATLTWAFESTDGAELDLSPLASLVQMDGGNINMRSNTLMSYTGFDCLKSISGNLVIENNDNLEIIDTFPLLETVGSNLQINNNTNLTSIPEFPSLISARFIQITGNGALTSVTGFPLLSDTGFFQVNQNNSIEVISGLNSLINLGEGIGLFQANPSSAVECNGQQGTLLCP